jgi:hypothetical protein
MIPLFFVSLVSFVPLLFRLLGLMVLDSNAFGAR